MQWTDPCRCCRCRFKDQGNKRRYQRDEDKLFNQAVNALKTADELYPDNPKGSSGSGAGRHADSNFAAGGGGSIGRARQSLSKPLPRPPRSKRARSFAPNLTEIFLILSGQSRALRLPANPSSFNPLRATP
jgi:hypothetical protein